MKPLSYGQSDRGLERDQNEDTFALSDELGIYVVADGMGGHSGGKVASEIAVNTVIEFLARYIHDRDFTWPFRLNAHLSEEENVLYAAIKWANRQVFNYSTHKKEYAGMGTTIVALYVRENKAVIGNVGDSRCYLLRNEEFTQLTTDHTWVNEQLKRNIISAEEARQHRWRNVITRALGNKRKVDIDIIEKEIQPGDTFLLCSDGLTNVISDDEIKRVLVSNQDKVKQSCEQLIRMAREHGGPDNITVIVLYFPKE